jgi:Fic family protein
MAGHELAIEWNGRPARAWLPDPLSARPLNLPVEVVRSTERAAAAVVRVGDRLPSGYEPLARLLLRAEGIASSNIEGLRAPVAQVAAAELDEAAAPREAALVAGNLAVVGDALEHAGSTRLLTIKTIHAWHRRLMQESGLPPHLIGAFRDAQGWIGGRGPQDAVYVPPPAPAVPALMDDLVAFVNAYDADAVTQAAVGHAQFETIHPYGDGNGRIGRLLVLWTLRRRLAVAVPPPTSVVIARDPGGYLSGLHWFRTGEDARWVTWFADVVSGSARAALEWADELDALMADWHARLGDLRADAAARKIAAATVARLVDVSDTAARTAIEQLHARGIVEPYAVPARGPGRPRTWWFAKELADLVRA